jgi:hypothetical protein
VIWNSTENGAIRRFGLMVAIIFGILFCMGIFLKKPIATFFFSALFFTGLGFILIPSLLRPVYRGWHKTARILGKIINTLILIIAYYTVITPAAFIKCIFGGHPLPTRPDNERDSYWVDRIEPVQAKERFIKRF